MTSFSRRAVSAAVLAAACPWVTPGGAAAQGQADCYPARAVSVIVPQAPGGTNDIVARVLAEAWAKRLGHSFVVENRPGAGGNIGTQAAAAAIISFHDGGSPSSSLPENLCVHNLA